MALSKVVGSSLTSAYKLRDRSPNITWTELKSELSRQYSSVFDSHATQAFAYLQKSSDELLEMYLHCVEVSFYQKSSIHWTCLRFQQRV